MRPTVKSQCIQHYVENCWCLPVVEVLPDGRILFLHRKWDKTGIEV